MGWLTVAGAAIENRAATLYTRQAGHGAISAAASGVTLGKGHLLIHAEAANRNCRSI
jgi:hypothetical protein